MDELDEVEEKYARMVGQVCPRCGAVLRVSSKRIRIRKNEFVLDVFKCENCGYMEEE